MTKKEIKEMCDLFGKCGYNDVNKARWKTLSMRFLRALRADLGIDAPLRFNPAGIACSGDATMHGDQIYVSFNADTLKWILYRTCKGREDYTGGPNHMHFFDQLRQTGVRGLADAIRSLLQVPTFEVRKSSAGPGCTAFVMGFEKPSAKLPQATAKVAPQKFEVSMADLQNDMADEGICLACGHRQGGCEPDAREYKCENEDCGQNKVYGLQEAMMMDAIEVTE